MFGWLRNRKRQLFRYWDGARWRRADPLRLWRRIVNEWDELRPLLECADTGKEPETTQAIQWLCGLFGVSRWSEDNARGLTDAELFGLLEQFYGYLDALKKSMGRGSMASQSMDGAGSNSQEHPSRATSEPSPQNFSQSASPAGASGSS